MQTKNTLYNLPLNGMQKHSHLRTITLKNGVSIAQHNGRRIFLSELHSLTCLITAELVLMIVGKDWEEKVGDVR